MMRYVTRVLSPVLGSLLMMCGVAASAQSVRGAGEVVPLYPAYSEQIMANDTLTRGLSPEALGVISRPMQLRTEGYVPSSSLFAPLLFDLWKLPSLHFDKVALVRSTDPRLHNPFVLQSLLRTTLDKLEREYNPTTGFAKRMDRWNTDQRLREQFFFSHPDLIRYTSDFLPTDHLEYKPVEGPSYSGELAVMDMPNVPTKSQGVIETVSVERRYWLPRFEAHAQLAQNQVSPNWHKGGTSSANLSSRLYYQLAYKKDKVEWVNDLEYKLGLFTVPSEIKLEEKPDFKISEDVFRMRSNLGLKAWKRWFYTVDLNLRSQLLNNYDREGNVTTRAFAPLIIDGGLGMKYNLKKKKIGGNPFNNLNFTLNVAPASMQFIWIHAKDVTRGRYGLQEDQDYLLRLGSSLRMNLDWQFSDAFSWRSRLYYNTSYKHIETELENTLEYAFNKYFSTMLNINLRFDDSVILDEPKTFKSLLQYNELFSFGFSLKI